MRLPLLHSGMVGRGGVVRETINSREFTRFFNELIKHYDAIKAGSEEAVKATKDYVVKTAIRKVYDATSELIPLVVNVPKGDDAYALRHQQLSYHAVPDIEAVANRVHYAAVFISKMVRELRGRPEAAGDMAKRRTSVSHHGYTTSSSQDVSDGGDFADMMDILQKAATRLFDQAEKWTEMARTHNRMTDQYQQQMARGRQPG